MITKKNQAEACAEVIRLMEERKGESITILGVPDEVERKNQAVDLHVRGITGEYHFEHTLIESFPGQFADRSRFMKLIFPLRESLKGRLPEGHFDLFVKAGTIAGTLDYKKIQAALEKWILEKTPLLLTKAKASNKDEYCTETPTDVPFEVALQCDPRLDNAFYVSPYVMGSDLEIKRRERIQTALQDKCPKLQEAKTRNGTSSVLILESNDLALANHFTIAAAFATELSKREDIPDEVYLVETDIPQQWTIWVLKEGPYIYPDLNKPGPRYIERKAE